MISLDGVCKSFEDRKSNEHISALSNVSLHIPEGEIIGVIGKSGAGKTTLLKLICGLLYPSQGRVRVMGLDPVKKRRGLSKNCCVLFANTTALNQYETVKNNLEILKSTYMVNNNTFNAELAKLSDIFGIADLMYDTVKDLSLGQRRRVELVSLFILQMDLIIMDEPCIGLDEYAKEKYDCMIKELHDKHKTVIISSHDLKEIDKICTRIILLDDGRIKFYGNRKDLYRQYAPIDIITVKCRGRLPNMQDLPIVRYTIDDSLLTISYNTNHITAAEIIRVLLQSSSISEVNIMKPSLEDLILGLEGR